MSARRFIPHFSHATQPGKAIIAGLFVFAAVLGCSDPEAAPAPVPALTIAPIGLPYLNVGQSITLVALSAAGTTISANWESSNPAVASVDAQGRVLALTMGSTFIVAVSPANARDRDSVGIQVFPPAPKGPLVLVFLDNPYVHGTTTVLDRAAVKGVIDVVAAHDVPAGVTVAKIEVRLNAQRICVDTLSAPKGRYTCTIDTRSFPNGDATLQARLLNANDSPMASATMQITLANQ